VITVLQEIEHYGHLKDQEAKGAAEALRHSIEKLKKLHRQLPWCCFHVPQRKTHVPED